MSWIPSPLLTFKGNSNKHPRNQLVLLLLLLLLLLLVLLLLVLLLLVLLLLEIGEPVGFIDPVRVRQMLLCISPSPAGAVVVAAATVVAT